MKLNHKLLMAMASAGVLSALAPPSAAFADSNDTADDNAEVAVAVADVGIRTALGDKIVEQAYKELQGTHVFESPRGSNCNYYSSYFGHGCQAWCADFTKYVWKYAGFSDWAQLNSEAGNTARWGNAQSPKRWHAGTTAGIFPGASVTYDASGNPLTDADHVGIFVGWVNGVPKVISGNVQNSNPDGQGGRIYKHNIGYMQIAGWTAPA